MKFLNLSIFLFALGLLMTSCSSDECPDVPCPVGWDCVSGVCVDPCETVICDAGFTCDNGNCISNGTAITKSGEITTDETWTADRFWLLDGKVIVKSGVTLTIEPGTIVKGEEGTETLASALVVERGGKLMAEGTADSPIIFTSVLDNIEVGEKFGTNLTGTDNEKWGGVIICGNAPISAKDGDIEANIEGLPPSEGYGKYGGSDAADNSGVIKYVSIRHGGVTIGEGNEINGLTLGGVGTGTVVDHVEVAANLDDGVEFFGGTVNATNIIVSWQGDDGIDIDMNYSGTVENFMVIHGGSDTDEALEIDGPEGTTYTDGLFTLRSGTCIALDTEKTSGGDLKSKAQGNINKVVWEGYSRYLKVRTSYNDDCTNKADAWTNVGSGALLASMCQVVSTSASAADVVSIYVDSDDQAQIDCFEAGTETADKEGAADAMIANNGNAVVTTATEGADRSEFTGWTWADNAGLVQ